MEFPKTNKKYSSDNGSTAVEVAIKVALQYFLGKKKTTIIAFENAFHGDTLEQWWNFLFWKLFRYVYRYSSVPVPVKGQNRKVTMLTIYNKNNNCAGFIYEPLVQGAAGMVMYEPESLDKLMQICKKMVFLRLTELWKKPEKYLRQIIW
jgi:adenosylmethionine-8-amino-7-oxononanoate aminotransferase